MGQQFLVASAVGGDRPSSSTSRQRPAPADVERLSRGQGAKQRGTGSRAVPHRLNAEERRVYELAAGRGFATVDSNLGYRRERKGSPLFNTWRMWNDARGHPAIFVVKRGQRRPTDELWLDLSTLRGELQDLATSPRDLVNTLDELLSENGVVELDGQPPDRYRQVYDHDSSQQDAHDVGNDAPLFENWQSNLGDGGSNANEDVDLIPTWRIQEVWLKYRFEDRARAKDAAKTVAEFFGIFADHPPSSKHTAKKSHQIQLTTDVLHSDIVDEDEQWLNSSGND